MSALDELYKEIASCQRCPLYETALKAVPGEGPQDARILFLGEAPGWHENQQGRPFVGAAGKFLDELLSIAGLRRQDVYITNVVKHWPPGNRDPQPSEVAACDIWFQRQLEIITPMVIVTLGRYSLNKFFPGESISRIHGAARRRDNTIYVNMYHPAAGLHQQSLRRVIEEDFRKLPAFLAEAEKAAKPEDKPQQLSMF